MTVLSILKLVSNIRDRHVNLRNLVVRGSPSPIVLVGIQCAMAVRRHRRDSGLILSAGYSHRNLEDLFHLFVYDQTSIMIPHSPWSNCNPLLDLHTDNMDMSYNGGFSVG